LVERLVRNEKARGSNPLTSKTRRRRPKTSQGMKNEVRPAPVLPKQNESPATQSQTPGDRHRRSIPIGVLHRAERSPQVINPRRCPQSRKGRHRRSIPIGVPPSRKNRRTRALPSSQAESRNLFPQLLHLATPALRFDQAAFGRPRALRLAPAIFGNLGKLRLTRGRGGGLQLGRQQTLSLSPIAGLGSRGADPHGDAGRQVTEGDCCGDLVDVLPARPARPAEDFFHFAWLPRMHPGTFPPDGRGDKPGHHSGGSPLAGHPWSLGDAAMTHTAFESTAHAVY